MISYMKDICNWTAGPMQYIYNSKQNTLEPVSSVSPPFLPQEMYLHIFKNIKSKNRQNTGYHSCYMLYISRECSKCTSSANISHNSTLSVCGSGSCVVAYREIQWILACIAIYTCNCMCIETLRKVNLELPPQYVSLFWVELGENVKFTIILISTCDGLVYN